jgi:outer membrane protein OmpA-like peptidoglycan-associated protein
MLRTLALLLTICLQPAVAALVAVVPNADKKGTADSALVKRYEGAYIVAQERKAFAEFTVPLAKLEPLKGERTLQNNERIQAADKKTLEGQYTRTAYLMPAGRTPLEVVRNYEEEMKRAGGTMLFQCKEAECGGDPSKSLDGGGGRMSLAMYLYAPERLTEERHTTGWCVLGERIAEQRYATFDLPASNAVVSVLVYRLVSPNKLDSCHPLNDRTVAVVDLVEAKPREQRMVTVPASEMERSISGSGHIALYGIYFDFNKADIKPESRPTLDEIAKLMRQSERLKLLVVGHTDNVGTYQFNSELSQRRAAEVVSALVTQKGIARERLTPVGVSFASPVTSNKTEEGRAKNRRVELVEH